ncbi:hypothetical protein QQS21_000435 [Conoideocrella luteorostrata]|uniref:Carboxylic ester hydrolase n=1 Tax=Conoideocrella luteorostrata TaxID=1105319 RepID=A0AAJ0G2J4_9HYPO|nr:hypothetical protein QQS21_000435 [Conoideocrella luteorostrata]
MAAATPTEPRADSFTRIATAIVPAGTILGAVKNGVESYNGIPFAEPPLGDLRMKPPVRLNTTVGRFDATKPAHACQQMILSTGSRNLLINLLGSLANLPLIHLVTGQTEDCLTVTVARPEGTSADAKLPVVFWIFGGAFELGWSSMYDGTSLINHAASLGQPFIFVAVNYRVAGYGFMPGNDIMAEGSGNAGLLDQRMGLEWVADNIAAFGGDPDKVTLWGESAGAISAVSQMFLYDGDISYKGKPLFRGAIMDSGSVIPTQPLDSPKGQAVYDQVVKTARCGNAADKLACLRALSPSKFLNAVTSVPGVLSYTAVALSYLPRTDGKTLTKSQDLLLLSGRYAKVPLIIGDQEDEGTLFSVFQPNLTTHEKLVEYLHTYYFPNSTPEHLMQFVNIYGNGTEAVTRGSPFGTGTANELTPGFKHRAAILGDLVFTLARRIFLTGTSLLGPNVPSWSYLASYARGTPVLGTFHGSDLLQVFFGANPNYATNSTRAYYTNFINNLDPNVGVTDYPNWPRWSEGNNLMQFFAQNSTLIKDDFRQEAADWILDHIDELRF